MFDPTAEAVLAEIKATLELSSRVRESIAQNLQARYDEGVAVMSDAHSNLCISIEALSKALRASRSNQYERRR